MNETSLFLLFPVYEEYACNLFYIKRIGLVEHEQMKDFIKRLDELKSVLAPEAYDGFYDSDNVKGFMMHTNILKSDYPKFDNLIRHSLVDWGTDWRKNRSTSVEETYTLWGIDICNDTLCEVARRMQNHPDCSYAVIDNSALKISDNTIPLNYDRAKVDVNRVDATVKSVAKWMANNRKPQRIFDFDEKHGEYGKGAHPSQKGKKVSSLLCSREEANDKLKYAVGIDAQSLFTYDEDKGLYMKFYKESPFIYHGHHVKNEDENNVPKRVKELIDMVK